MNEIPEFLLTNASRSTIDQKKLLLDLQLLGLWREIHGNKPYNHADAIKLQVKLAMKHATHRQQQKDRQRKERENVHKSLQSICWLVAERVLGIEITCDGKEISVPNGIINFNTKVRDKRLGKVLGKVKQILQDDHIDFTGCGDPRIDLKDFIHNLRRYDKFARRYTFERPIDYDPSFPRIIMEKAPFPEKVPRYVSFILTFKWSPFSDKQILKQAKKWLKSYVR